MLNPADPGFLASLPEELLRAVRPADLEEPRGRWQGQGGAVATPRNTAEVSLLVRACAAARVGIVPLGGGTGLVGGQVMPEGPMPLILSFERMTAIRAVHPQENVIVAEAGAILADIHAAAEAQDRMFPLTLASQGSARIGGNLATNAGGVNVLRYGNARDLCLGVEAVLADGTVFHGLKRLRKDNTGYDLRHLLIGAEGTLGLITAASLKLFPRPAVTGAALFVVPDPQAALALLSLAESQLPGMVSGFELIHRQGLDFLAETLPDLRQPFAVAPEWCVLVDIGLPAALDATEALMSLYEAAGELVLDGVIAQSGTQRLEFWTLRETIPEANRRVGSISSHDISLPLSAIPAFLAEAAPALAQLGDFRINCFGHLGDGNLHYNVFPAKGRQRAEYDGLREAVKTCVHDLVHRFDGSISAEHGIGRLKVKDLETYGDPVKLIAMRAIKTALDPLGILNPGAVLRA
ncbi:MAG: hydroxyacid dehydrogenase [Rhodobacterales bacterium 65-51]|uniref:FAD-binding oxidoreductase n=1 Tax=uncultured Gemmobacter sp. TaxID=1095917 RepID=UPI000963B040|nr:FAD-binding oxidoreductase [uncultured Gemmobacter sp.]OJY28662.1 MAG: hydroxyacid dehydrogenase [Rhodobacterales bacterium 65-51]